MSSHEKEGEDPRMSNRTCNLCGATFAKPYFLRIHKVKQHGIQDPRLRVSDKCVSIHSGEGLFLFYG